MWYPFGSRDNELITGSLSSNGNLCAAILPHAGLYYSGALIRSFFEKIDKKRVKVLIISPSHYYALPAGAIITSDFTFSETPFRDVPTCKAAISGSIINDDVIQQEHGIEMFLPFIGKKGNMSVSYAVISSLQNASDAKEIAEKIAKIVDTETALIASSDFTHYGPRFNYFPFGQNALKKVEQHDSEAANLLAENKGEEAYRAYCHSTICGIAPASIVAEVARIKGWQGSCGPHATSLDGKEKDENFVSYRTVFWRKNE